MNDDLKIIKKNYGEKMMHLCRRLFPTILEEPGLLSSVMLKNFAPDKLLYEHLTEKYIVGTLDRDIEKDNIEYFKNYIYSLVANGFKPTPEPTKTPEELLSEAGYELFECKTEADIQHFRKYYAPGEELCTFNDQRTKTCLVFFAIKKNVNQIQRKNFENPHREDEYGTSVISIQFSKGDINTLSIKNRYNHTVDNPDATFNNNLENIIPGLTTAFEKKYKLSINQSKTQEFNFPGFVLAADGKYYKYNYEINNVYYCPNNIIIDNFVVKEYPKEKYLIIDYFIIDLENENITLYDKSIEDSFIDGIWNIKKISITNIEDYKKRIIIETQTKNKIEIEIDKNSKIIGYKNERLTKIGDNFLYKNKSLILLSLDNLEKVGNYFLSENNSMLVLSLPNLKEFGCAFMTNNILERFDAPKLSFINNEYTSDIIKKLTTKQHIITLPIRHFCEDAAELISEANPFYFYRESPIIRARRTKKEITKLIKRVISKMYLYTEKIEKRRKK